MIDPKTVGQPATKPGFPDLATQLAHEELEAEKKAKEGKPAEPAPAEPVKPAEPAPAEPVKPAEPAKPVETPAEPAKPAEPIPAEPKPRDPKDATIIALKRKQKEKDEAHEKELGTLKSQLENLQQTPGNDKPTPEQQAKIDEAKTKLETKIKTLAEAHNVTPELLTAITDLVKEFGPSVELDPEVMKVIETAKAKQQEEAQKQEEERIVSEEDERFDTEFTSDIANNADLKTEIEASGLSVSALKAKLFDFLYSEAGHKYATVPLKEIFQLKKADLLPPKKKSAEHGGGAPIVPGESGGEQSIEALRAKLATTPAGPEFEKLSNQLAQMSKSPVMRGGKRVNQTQ